MANYCILRIEKIKSFEHMQAAYNHNYRIKEVPNADPQSTEMNHETVSLNGKTYVEAFQDLTKELGYGPEGKPYRKNGILCLEVVLSFSPGARASIDIEKWEKDNLDFVANSFTTTKEGQRNILGAVTHFDEHAIHQHILVVPLVEDKICANHFIDGRQKLSDLQSAYAQKMESHGLIRGISGSTCSHQDIHRYYGSLSKALDVTIPEWATNDTPESYCEKVKEDIKNRAAVYLRKETEHESELRKERDIHNNETRELKKQLASAKRTIHRYQQKEEELEHELGSVESVKRVIKSVQLMQKALEEMEPHRANEFIDQLNEMVARQRKLEREQAKRAEARKKSIFEKV